MPGSAAQAGGSAPVAQRAGSRCLRPCSPGVRPSVRSCVSAPRVGTGKVVTELFLAVQRSTSTGVCLGPRLSFVWSTLVGVRERRSIHMCVTFCNWYCDISLANGTGTNIGTRVPLGPRRSPAAGVLRRPRPSALHVRHSYPNALRASPRALGASATPLANPVLLLFLNSNTAVHCTPLLRMVDLLALFSSLSQSVVLLRT